jgi:hypothetical protein
MSQTQPILSAVSFQAIQRELGLDDAALGRRLFRVDAGPAYVAQLSAGITPISDAVSFAMIGFLDHERAARAHVARAA